MSPKRLLLLTLLFGMLLPSAGAHPPPVPSEWREDGTNIIFTPAEIIDCQTGVTCTNNNGVVEIDAAGGSGAPDDATYITLSTNATLTNERVLTEGTAIDLVDGGAGTTETINFDSTEVEATTWGAGGNASNAWTFNLSGTDPVVTFGSATITLPTSALINSDASGGGFQVTLNNSSAALASGSMVMRRARGTAASQLIVSDDDEIGAIYWKAMDDNGGSFQNAARIDAFVDGTPSSGDMPGRLVFWTTPDGSSNLVERLFIYQDGTMEFGDGDTTSGVLFSQDGDGQLEITGRGTGADECLALNLDDTANEATFTNCASSTGVTQANFSGMDLYVSGTGPDVRWAVTGSDTFHLGAEAPGTLILSNTTDGLHYLVINSAHAMTFGAAGTVPLVDFNSTRLQIPNGSNPTTSAAGDIAVDSSATSGSMLRFYGDAAYALPAYQSKSFTITGATTASDFGHVWRVPYAITLRAVHCLTVGGTNVVGQLQECDSNAANCADVDADMTCTAATNVNDDGSFTNPTIDAGDYLGVKTTSVSGTNTRITWSFEYTVDQAN